MTAFYRRAKRTQNPGLFELTFGSDCRESALRTRYLVAVCLSGSEVVFTMTKKKTRQTGIMVMSAPTGRIQQGITMNHTASWSESNTLSYGGLS